MSKTIKLGMVFDSSTAPDFGSIERVGTKEYQLLADDITKLNSTLTKTHLAPLVADGSVVDIPAGSDAIVLDYIAEETAAVYRYHAQSDEWYPVISGE